MSATKTPKMLLAIAILAFAGAAFLAGCGGAGGTTSADQNPPANPPSEPVEPKEEEGASKSSSEGESPSEEKEEEGTEGETAGGAEAGGAPSESEGSEGGTEAEGGAGESEEGGAETAGGSAEGMEIFTSNCGSCHTLKAAGTSGNVGPNLDELMPSESTVETQVINGGGAMPAFGKEGILEEGEVKAVAEYVSSVAGE